MNRLRLDQLMLKKGLVSSRSQAESWIKLGEVSVDGEIARKPGQFVIESANVKLLASERYVSRAGLKLASVAAKFNLDFKDKVVLDVGSSTGGFTDYALQHGAKKVIAVDVGTYQLHPSLRDDQRIELHEKTDIRDFKPSESPEIVVMDVSFISLRQILPHIFKIIDANSQVVAMVKPQFEAGVEQVSKGVIKNDTVRRQILKEFEAWSRQYFIVKAKHDSEVSGATGNLERFYLLQKLVG